MKKKIIYILPLALVVIAATAFVVETQILKSKPATFHSVAKPFEIGSFIKKGKYN